MADDQNITLAQLKKFMSRADVRLDALELGKAAKVRTVSISIPATAWVANTDTAVAALGYAYCTDVAVSGLGAQDVAETDLDIASRSAAKTAGMADFAATTAGAIRYYAVTVPTQALSAQVSVYQGATI